VDREDEIGVIGDDVDDQKVDFGWEIASRLAADAMNCGDVIDALA